MLQRSALPNHSVRSAGNSEIVQFRVLTDNGLSVSDRTCRIVLLLVIAVGAILRIWGLRFGVPYTFARPDEEFVINAALNTLRDGNPHFFEWPSLFMYVAAGAYGVLFPGAGAVAGVVTEVALTKPVFEPTLHLILRWLSAGAGILTIAVLYGASKELFCRRVALIAAGFLAVAYLHVRDSHFGVTDVPATFLTVGAFWASVRCATRPLTLSRVAFTGLLCGLAASTKYNVALVLLPAFLAVRAHPRSPGPAALAIVTLILGAALGFFLGTPFALLDRPAFAAGIAGVRGHMAGGHVVMTRGWIYHAAFTLRYGVGLIMLIAAILGAVWLLVRQSRVGALVLAFPAAYYAVVGSALTVFVRYMVPLVPFLCLTAAFFVDRIIQFADEKFGIGRARGMFTLVLVLIVAAPTAVSSVAFDRLMTRTDTRVLGADWIAATFPSSASIYQTGLAYGHLQLKPAGRYTQYAFAEQAGLFVLDGRPAPDLPEIIVVIESPLRVYTQVPPQLGPTLQAEYVPRWTLDSVPRERLSNTIYDQEDAFFAPFVGIENATRPGPNLRIFERRQRRPE
jgi:4-amino-4-deoxy-L-arabinose transferase-like glycosyltransferase